MMRGEIDDANERMRAMMLPEAWEPVESIHDDRMRSVWEPLAERLRATDPPPHREAEAERLAADYIGALPSGDLVVWGPDTSHAGRSVRYFQILSGGADPD